jgi:hypothetical protein
VILRGGSVVTTFTLAPELVIDVLALALGICLVGWWFR